MSEKVKKFLKPPDSVYVKGMLGCSLNVSTVSKIKRNYTVKVAQVIVYVLGSQKEMAMQLLSSLLTT